MRISPKKPSKMGVFLRLLCECGGRGRAKIDQSCLISLFILSLKIDEVIGYKLKVTILRHFFAKFYFFEGFPPNKLISP